MRKNFSRNRDFFTRNAGFRILSSHRWTSTAHNKGPVHSRAASRSLGKGCGAAACIFYSWFLERCCKMACVLQMNPCEGRPCYETQRKAPVRSQSVSLESKRGACHCRLSEGSNCLHAGRTRGFCFLHSERQGREDRRLRAGEGSRGRTSGNRRFLWVRGLERTATASGSSLRH